MTKIGGGSVARPSRCRRICEEPGCVHFVPAVGSEEDPVCLTVDEYEVIRLIDLEKLTHEQCAGQMDISRTTVTEIYEAAREKLADSLVNGKPLLIAGGHYRLCDGSAACHCQKNCRKKEGMTPKQALPKKGAEEMKVAVTYENGNVFQHFGHTEEFKIYDVADGKIEKEEVVSTNGSGHGALAGFLKENGVDTLICGGIGGGAQAALAEAGIQLFGGVSGEADEAVKALIAGTLGYNPNVQCSHHEHGEHEHACGSHGCGEHHCGH